jgi:uncharacterized protein
MLFEWGESKREANLAKHHIDFQDAKRVDGPVFEKMESCHGEDRIFAMGLMEDIEIVVVYVMRGERRRIISARRAHRDERQDYTNHLRGATKGKNDFKPLREMRDADIDDSDIPKLGKSFWKAAKLTMPEPKDRLTIRVDHDVVEWLKKKRQRLPDPH